MASEMHAVSAAVTTARSARDQYAIAGGVDGKRRLNLLAEIMRPTTLEPFDMAGVREGQMCVDVGCASETEIDDILAQMERFAADPSTLVASPRIVQAYGRLDG